jgi:hypothetical protein
VANNALSTVTVWSPDPAALGRVQAQVAPRGASRRAPASAFSLEAVVPSGMDPAAWDRQRAVELWGTARPETDATLEEVGPDRLVYRLATAYAPPYAALQALTAAHPDVVVHAVTTCESEYASTAWFVRGTVVGEEERELDLTDEQWDEWDGEWDLPASWSFDAARARDLGE